jgi:hypothetical protein
VSGVKFFVLLLMLWWENGFAVHCICWVDRLAVLYISRSSSDDDAWGISFGMPGIHMKHKWQR